MRLHSFSTALAFAAIAGANANTISSLSPSVTTTVTAFSGTASTSYVFLPGQSPTATRMRARQIAPTPGPNVNIARAICNADNCLRALSRQPTSAGSFCATYTKTTNPTTTNLPAYIPQECGPSRISSACSCISTSSTLSTSSTVNAVTTATVTTTTTVQTPPKTTTIYPCASPISSPAYGVAQSFNANEGPITTTTYNLTTSDGSSALACCNKCFFESQNCVRALYNSPNSIVTSNPMGCIVSTAPQAVGDNVDAHRTGSCPAGVINGLYYTPSDGSQIHIAGPCGYLYENL